ncbi:MULTISPECIES: hypothetical protein [unclassified Aurantimonas]|uniref:hypothetical protein n=1 Tax=unclassified Aurantimonas TaxID=2638230 RepID=UPI002E16C1E8|nr:MULTISPECIES: hypothetical protein [unclassified Aurantimonas]MEC5289395.1 hypothetical protein [Aurantimonas sp. C2-3-R2]MEC5410475.1 hypothetical protein [Aurantimonas sp. C2-4-R8]
MSAPMTTDPDRPLKTLILDLTLKVMDLQAQVRRMEEAQERHHRAMFDWCAPQSLKDEIIAIDGVGFDETAMPSDVAGSLDEWMKRGR